MPALVDDDHVPPLVVQPVRELASQVCGVFTSMAARLREPFQLLVLVISTNGEENYTRADSRTPSCQTPSCPYEMIVVAPGR